MKENSIEFILNDIFYNGTKEAIKKLKKHNLYEILQKALIFYTNSIDENKINKLNVEFTKLIIEINTKLKKLSHSEEKEHIKYLFSNIGEHLISNLWEKKLINQKDLIQLNEFLKQIFDIHDYDFKDLSKRISFLNKYSQLSNDNQIHHNRYYEWNGKINCLDYISKNLKSEKLISSIKDFKKLFTDEPILTRFDRNNNEFIVVLFDTLYEEKLIKPKKTKGHLAPLKAHAVDFDEKVLFTKEMKHIKYTIKKNESKYSKLRNKAKKWIVH